MTLQCLEQQKNTGEEKTNPFGEGFHILNGTVKAKPGLALTGLPLAAAFSILSDRDPMQRPPGKFLTATAELLSESCPFGQASFMHCPFQQALCMEDGDLVRS